MSIPQFNRKPPILELKPVAQFAEDDAPVNGQYALFASALTHEVRNPLTNINLALGRLKELYIDEEQRDLLDIILRASNRIESLISALGADEHPGSWGAEGYSMHKLLDEVLSLEEDRVRLKKIKISKTYGSEDYKAALNWPRMKIALTNLIINAIEAMEPEKGELKLSSTRDQGQYVVRVEDNGCGINAENLKHIFQPYFTRKPGGLGIGLSTAYEILQTNHVSVDVQSSEGAGTCFILTFNKEDTPG